MDRKQRVTLTVTLLALTVLGFAISLYYYESWTINKPVDTNAQKGDFQIQVHFNKTKYREGEAVAINLKLIYLGKTPITIYSYPEFPFLIRIKNATKNVTIESVEGMEAISPYSFTSSGQYITENVALTGGFSKYRSNDPYFPAGSLVSEEPFDGFSPGSTYWIQVTTKIYTDTKVSRFNNGTELTTPWTSINIISK